MARENYTGQDIVSSFQRDTLRHWPRTRLLTEERFITKTAIPNAATAQQLEQASTINPERCQICTSRKRDSPSKTLHAVWQLQDHMHVGCTSIRGTRIVLSPVSEGSSF